MISSYGIFHFQNKCLNIQNAVFILFKIVCVDIVFPRPPFLSLPWMSQVFKVFQIQALQISAQPIKWSFTVESHWSNIKSPRNSNADTNIQPSLVQKRYIVAVRSKSKYKYKYKHKYPPWVELSWEGALQGRSHELWKAASRGWSAAPLAPTCPVLGFPPADELLWPGPPPSGSARTGRSPPATSTASRRPSPCLTVIGMERSPSRSWERWAGPRSSAAAAIILSRASGPNWASYSFLLDVGKERSQI